MAVTSYITLTNSNSTLTKRFRVVADNYDDGTPEKTATVQKTIGGTIDVSQGGIHTTWTPIIHVRHTETDSNYGTYSDLATFFGYNNPNGVPSDKITFVDHHGTSRTVVMLGGLQKSVLTADIEGENAHILVKVSMLQIA